MKPKIIKNPICSMIRKLKMIKKKIHKTLKINWNLTRKHFRQNRRTDIDMRMEMNLTDKNANDEMHNTSRIEDHTMLEKI